MLFRPPIRQAAPSRIGFLLAVVVCLGAVPRIAYGWGPSAHRLVNAWAIETLPQPLKRFFTSHRSYLTEHASDADGAIQQDGNEWKNHYVHLDKYGRFPYTGLPQSFPRAVQIHGSRKLNRNGVLPWRIAEFKGNLTRAFENEDWEAVMEHAATLGHYVTDAHQPLHTSSNYDGQLTGQAGLANRYGSGLVDRYINFFIMRPERSAWIEDPTEHAFTMVLESHIWVDNLLLADRQSRKGLVGYTDEYYDNLYSSTSGMLMRQINAACHDVGSYWYTAWVNAGRPPLPSSP
ncbi:MAG: hypothetical protein O6850_07370 [Acidobacteria bacterium]|nr:hypothetical protein [Acidobacteriota bacterium]